MNRSQDVVSRTPLTILLIILLAIFVIDPIVVPFHSVLRLAHLMMAGLVVVVSLCICRSQATRVTTITLGVVSLGLSMWAAGAGGMEGLLADAASLAFVAFVMAYLVTLVFSHEVVTGESVNGALCAYLLFGFGCASLYSILDRLVPGSFHGIVDAQDVIGDSLAQENRQDDFIYFSFVTLTTVGYGEITPKSASARAVANLQAVAGQLYIAVMIARLVGLQAASSASRKHE